MDAPGALGDIDLLPPDDVRTLVDVEGPCVSIFLPTHRAGSEVAQGPIRLRNLVTRAERALEGGGASAREADAVLAPVRALADDTEFWVRQGDGLAVFAAPGFLARYRLPLSLAEEVTVGPSFRVTPLVPLLSGDGRFLLLALSQNAVRLFEASRHRIGELELGPIPTSMDEALAHEDPERQLQVRSGGGDSAMFHGHGAGGEVERAAVERFLRAVGRGLRQRLGGVDRPLVLAAVAEHLPVFKAVSGYPDVVDAAVEGSPDRRTAEQLHAAAWPLVEDRFTADLDAELERYGAVAGTGKATSAPDEVAIAAAEGRVDRLFVVAGAAPDEQLDRAVLATLTSGGRVHEVDEPLDEGSPIAAVLRY